VLGLNKGLLRRGSLFCFCTFCKRWIKVTYDLKNAKDYNIVPNTHAWPYAFNIAKISVSIASLLPSIPFIDSLITQTHLKMKIVNLLA
jgi:hypothetical protein